MTTGTGAATRRRAAAVGRRVWFGLLILLNLILLWLTLVWPGWQAVPFLTPEAAAVVPVWVASLAVGIAVNTVDVVTDSRVLRALGDVVTSAMALAVAVRLWQVFPFDFAFLEVGRGLDWQLLTRGLLGIVMAGSAIAIVSGIVTAVRLIVGRDALENVVGPH